MKKRVRTIMILNMQDAYLYKAKTQSIGTSYDSRREFTHLMQMQTTVHQI